MSLALSSNEWGPRRRYSEFAQTFIAPYASQADQDGVLPPDSISALRRSGYLGSMMTREVGGRGLDQVEYGMMTGEIARACSAARTLITVHDIVTIAVARWGSPSLRASFLPLLSEGTLLAAFALSEPDAGSGLEAISTRIEQKQDCFLVNGEKSWISFGGIADIILVVGLGETGHNAVLIPRETKGLTCKPIPQMVGARGAMPVSITFNQCEVPLTNIVGRPGFGLSHVAQTALDHGRYSVAWGAVGIAEAALTASLEYTRARKLPSGMLADQALVRRHLVQMATEATAARLMCMEAGRMRQDHRSGFINQTLAAKYFSSKAAVAIANAAIQLHGARGMLSTYPLERLLRDAKVTEIIEGSSEVLELLIRPSLLDIEETDI